MLDGLVAEVGLQRPGIDASLASVQPQACRSMCGSTLMSTRAASAPRSSILAKPAVDEPPAGAKSMRPRTNGPLSFIRTHVFSCILPKVGSRRSAHFACRMTVPSETVGAAAPALLAFFSDPVPCHFNLSRRQPCPGRLTPKTRRHGCGPGNSSRIL